MFPGPFLVTFRIKLLDDIFCVFKSVEMESNNLVPGGYYSNSISNTNSKGPRN